MHIGDLKILEPDFVTKADNRKRKSGIPIFVVVSSGYICLVCDCCAPICPQYLILFTKQIHLYKGCVSGGSGSYIIYPIIPQMLIDNTLPLVDKLIALDGSTTLFLESLRGARLMVKIESQTETYTSSRQIITRAVKLFFESAEIPILYCKSFLNRDQLTAEEYRLLMTKEIPIGIVFHHFNEAGLITKRNISINKETNPGLAAFLHVKSGSLFKKRYEYWVGNREVGYICEFFNEESLARI